MSWYVFLTDWGWAAFKGNSNTASNVLLPLAFISDLQSYIGNLTEINILSDHDHSIPVVNQIRRYYRGKVIEDWLITPELDFLPLFTRQVLNYVARIPYGKTLTYGEIAAAIGNPRAIRAVGQAVGRNPLPLIIPCHRVVAQNGWGGFSAPGGVELKKKMLHWEHEANVCQGDGVIDI